MVVIPAIDLCGGKCVRLLRGDFQQATIYGDDPVAMALHWQDQGAERLHIVDLDGSRLGKPTHRKHIVEIARKLQIPVEVGGGIRTMADVVFYLDSGIRWLILGTAVLRDEIFVRDACRLYGRHILLGVDARDGQVAVGGWLEQTPISAIALVKRFAQSDVSGVVYTDIQRDGTETGVNIAATRELAEAVAVPVIASGGVADRTDIERVLLLEPSGVSAVIVGRALYSGRLSLPEAIRYAKRRPLAEKGGFQV